MRRGRVALLILLAAGVASCGGDDEGEESRTVPRPRLTVPTETSTSERPATQTETTPTQEATEPPASPPANPPQSGGGSPPRTPSRSPSKPKPKPDQGQGQGPPPKGSPAERFEQFCEANPGACG